MKDTGNGKNTIVATLFSKAAGVNLYMEACCGDLQGESQGTHAIPFSELPKRIRFVGRKNKTLRFRAHRHRTTIEPTGIHKSTVHIGMGS